jgi:cytochrome P450
MAHAQPRASTTTHQPPRFPLARHPSFDPPAEYARFRDSCPVVPVALRHGQQAWLITRYEDVRTVLRDHETFSSDPSRPGFPQLRPVVDEQARPGTFIVTDPALHTRYRRMLAGEFTARRTKALIPVIEQIVQDCLDDLLCGPQPADLLESFALPIPARLICRLLGVPYADREFFVSRSRMHTNRSLPAEEVASALAELEAYLDELIGVRLRTPTDDLISRLAVERVSTGELQRAELVGMATLLLVAGLETTANSISLSVLALLEHPDQWAALVADPDLVDDAVEELMRYLTVVHHGLARAVRRDTTLSGRRIRAGEGVIVSLHSANHDTVRYGGADKLDIHRDAHNHVAFGFGIHQCIGQLLARVEMRAALRGLVRTVPDLRPAVELSAVPFRFDAPVYGVHSLPVTW